MNRTLALASIIVLLSPAVASAQTAPSASPEPSPTPSAAPLHYSFTPPATWAVKPLTPTSSALIHIGSWATANSTETFENIKLDLVSSVKDTPIEKIAAAHRTTMARIAGDNNVKMHPEKICGGAQDGYYMEMQMQVGVTQFVTEQIVAVGSDGEYIVTYGRLKSVPESPAARASLNTLCAKSVSQ